jgi:hypothetical protein
MNFRRLESVVNSRLAARRTSIAFCLLSVAAFAATRAEAQAYRYGAGWTVGGSYLTSLNPDPASATALELDPGLGFLFGVHLERAYGSIGRFALRYQGTYLQPQFQWAAGERTIDAVSADVSGLIRLMDPTDAGAIQPYVMAGAGGIWYDLGRGPATSYPIADAYHDGGSRVLPLAAFGIGVDAPLFDLTWDASPVRLRFEVGDHMTFGSPLKRVSDRERYGPVHHVRFTIGAFAAIDPIR